jgi:hypothetical protein
MIDARAVGNRSTIRRAVPWALLSVVLAACAATHKPKTRQAELRAVVEPSNALVQVDETFVGAARVLEKRPAQLSPGKHRVTVDAAGYFPHDVELDLAPGVTTLTLKLRAIPR